MTRTRTRRPADLGRLVARLSAAIEAQGALIDAIGHDLSLVMSRVGPYVASQRAGSDEWMAQLCAELPRRGFVRSVATETHLQRVADMLRACGPPPLQGAPLADRVEHSAKVAEFLGANADSPVSPGRDGTTERK